MQPALWQQHSKSYVVATLKGIKCCTWDLDEIRQKTAVQYVPIVNYLTVFLNQWYWALNVINKAYIKAIKTFTYDILANEYHICNCICIIMLYLLQHLFELLHEALEAVYDRIYGNVINLKS